MDQKHLLVIEDEPQIRRFLRATLTGQGYRLFEAPTGADGLVEGEDVVAELAGLRGAARRVVLRVEVQHDLLPGEGDLAQEAGAQTEALGGDDHVFCHQRGIFKGTPTRGVGEIEEVRIDLDPVRRDEMMQKTKRRTVPQIYIGDTHVGGCDDLVALDAAGELKPLLACGA